MADRFPEPVEAKKFLSKKVDVESDAWDDLKWWEHAHAFTVAHSIKAGVVHEIHGLLTKALTEGQSFEDFRKGLLTMMEQRGWYGRADKTKDNNAYINWRIKVIYNTNMRTAYAAARYRRQLAAAKLRPIWVYRSKLVGNRRQEHLGLHGKALRYDDPFWNRYYPPNGWECKCFVETRSEEGAKQDKVPVLTSGTDGNPPSIDGVDWNKFADETWQYNVGREALAPNFSKYEKLKTVNMTDGKSAFNHVVEGYQQAMTTPE
jgi:SPP1 gp7 family putative phage head morphogenesis protein